MRVTLKQIAKRTGLTWHGIWKRRQREGWQPCGKRLVNHNPAEEFEVAALPNDLKVLFPESPGNNPVVDGGKAHATGPSTAVPPSERGRVSCAPAQPCPDIQDAATGMETPPPLVSAAASFADQEQNRDLPPDQLAPAQLLSTPAAKETGITRLLTNGTLSQPTGAEVISSASSVTTKISSPISNSDIPVTAIPEAAKKIALARMDLLRIWKGFRGRFASLAQGDQEFERWYQTGHGVPHLHNILGDISVGALRKWDQALAGSSDWHALVPRYKWSGMVLQTSLDIQVRRIFERFLLDPRRHTISKCIFYTRHALEIQGIPCESSESMFRRYAEWFKKTHNDVWVFRREGNKALWDKVLLYIKRDASLLDVGDCLVADGHRLNFQIVNPFTGRPVRATMIGYLDWKSYDMAGYEIMIEENTQCIASALRHGMLKLGKAPRFCYQDNGKAFRAKYFTHSPSFEEAGFAGLFARFNIIPVFSLPYNARAKVIERWWRIFSESFERLMPSYVGASIDDKPAYLKRNEKFHKALRGEYVPTIWEAVEMIDQWLALWSSRNECPHVKGKTIREVFDSGRGPGIDAGNLDDLMLDAKITKLYQNGVKMWGEYYWNEALYGKQYGDVTVRYSIFDKSAIRVYANSGAFICTAVRTQEMNPLVNYLGDETEKKQFKNMVELRGRLRKGTIDQAKRIEEAPLPIAVNMSALPAAPQQGIDGVAPGRLMMRQADAQKSSELQRSCAYNNFVAYSEPAEIQDPPKPPIIMFESDREDAEKKHKKDMDEFERRRVAHSIVREKAVIRAGLLEMDLDRQRVRVKDVVVDLLPMEFLLLRLLIGSRGRVFSRAEIRDVIHGNVGAGLRVIDVHVRRLRAALEKVGAERYVITKYGGAGYYFSEED